MAQIYRANVVKIEAAANGTLNADVFVELRGGVTPDFTWTLTSNGHFTIVLTAAEVLAITNNVALTPVQKRLALRELIKAQALERGVDQADEAYAAWIALLPTFPDPITIR
jgi:hypothetical protein